MHRARGLTQIRGFMTRMIAYIDGFNLRGGIKESNWKRYYWLDIQRLAGNLLGPGETLEYTKYFTARISGSPEKMRRQNNYLEALSTLRRFDIVEGQFEMRSQSCPKCGHRHFAPTEKRTDVNIAVHMICDGLRDLFDAALLISGDSDLVPPVEAIRNLLPTKRVVVAFPPKRHSKHLQSVAHQTVPIGRVTLQRSQLPQQITRADGFLLVKPAEWF